MEPDRPLIAGITQETDQPLALAEAVDTDEVRATGLDVTDPEMVDTVFTGATKVNGHIWGLSWSGKYFAQYWGHAIAFNKRIVEEAGYKSDDIYQAVRDFKWDWDMFVEIAKAVSNDSDGNGVNDVDGYCLMPNECALQYMQKTAGINTAVKRKLTSRPASGVRS